MSTTRPVVADRLRLVVLRLSRAIRREPEHLGVTGGQALVLGLINAEPGIGVRALARRENISSPAVTMYVRRLERADLIRRERSVDDARCVGLYATDRGLEVLDRVRNVRTEWLARRLAQLTDAEIDALEAAIEPLEKILASDPP